MGELGSDFLNQYKGARGSYHIKYKRTVVLAISPGSCFPQRGCLHVERQGLCPGWLCGFKNAPQPRRQWVSCRSGGVLFLTQPAAREACISKVLTDLQGAPVTWQAEREPNLTSLSAADEATDQECPSRPEGRAHLLHHASGL